MSQTCCKEGGRAGAFLMILSFLISDYHYVCTTVTAEKQ